ncbi:hypothetical protein AB0442_38215 [Kitasatospora sp. NPDC085895]|uniref:hypothetical protein n=1 Tax=Kitasatospora sp. NPDC085895 TaxID=3155057 RepID=UPI00344FB056
MVTIEAARAAKRALAQMLADDPRVNGVGIGGTKSAYVVKVQLVSDDDRPDLPQEIDGVPVQTVAVGRIKPLSTAHSE